MLHTFLNEYQNVWNNLSFFSLKDGSWGDLLLIYNIINGGLYLIYNICRIIILGRDTLFWFRFACKKTNKPSIQVGLNITYA